MSPDSPDGVDNVVVGIGVVTGNVVVDGEYTLHLKPVKGALQLGKRKIAKAIRLCF